MPNLSRRDFAHVAAALPFTRLANASTPDDESLCKLTIADPTRMIRAKQITATALIQSCIQRAKIYNPKVNAYITLMADGALAEAGRLDAEAKAGKFRGPLHGIPIALKDNIDTAGVRTTGGSAVYDDRFPDTDAEVVRRLKAAGAIMFPTANLQEL